MSHRTGVGRVLFPAHKGGRTGAYIAACYCFIGFCLCPSFPTSLRVMQELILQGDCLEIMQGFSDKSFDLVLTDPPYGIGADKGVGGFGVSNTDQHYNEDWDSHTPTKEVFDEIIRVSKNAIIFGGQFFTDKLPPNGHWIVWDKKGDIQFDNPFGDCELAWTNVTKKSVKKYVVIQQGFISDERIRFHPTQKPVSLFEQILNDYTTEGASVLDPFAGSCTTAIAAKALNRGFVCIEKQTKYIGICNERLSSMTSSLF